MFVVYEWGWLDVEQMYQNNDSEIYDDSDDGDNSADGDDSDDGDDDQDDSDSFVTHTITFKCIGASRETSYQTALQAALECINEGKDVPVKLIPEPDNPKDSRAIAFHCFVGEKWRRIGYIVKEALQDVHDALKNNQILSVKFAWVKFLLCWSQCGPGFYAGIDISRKGNWPTNIMRCASTK